MLVAAWFLIAKMWKQSKVHQEVKGGMSRSGKSTETENEFSGGWGRGQRGLGVTAKGCKTSLGDNKSVLKLTMVRVVQLCECTKSH